MSDKSAIEWTDASWNPVTGCSKASPGCANCYAETLSLRFGHSKLPWTPANAAQNVVLHPERLGLPLTWRKPRRVFVNSMSDLFHELVPFEYVDHVFAVMAWAQRHTFQILTKRPDRMAAYLTEPLTFANPVDAELFARDDRETRVEYAMCDVCNGGQQCRGSEDCELGGAPGWPLLNVWLGTSIENDRWTGRADALRETPAAVRFLSLEPLLGPLPSLDLTGIDWVIVGGESGPGARPMHSDWVRDIRDRCVAARVAFFFKQWGDWKRGSDFKPSAHVMARDGRLAKFHTTESLFHGESASVLHLEAIRRVGKGAAGRELDGRTWDEYPTSKIVR